MKEAINSPCFAVLRANPHAPPGCDAAFMHYFRGAGELAVDDLPVL